MRRWFTCSCVALLAAQGCTSHPPVNDSTVVPAVRLRSLEKENRERLAGIDSPRHLSHTIAGVDITDKGYLQAAGSIIWSFPIRLYRFINGDTPVKWAAAMEDANSPDRRREGIAELALNRFARKDPYTKRYAQIGNRDTEYLVRAEAIRALNYSRDKAAVEVYVTGLDDAEFPVRLEAAKALANVPTDRAIPKLIERLRTDDNKDVRIAAADALRNFKTIDVARALAAVMLDRDFAVAWQARQSLMLMTGRDFRYDEASWLDYLTKGQKPFL